MEVEMMLSDTLIDSSKMVLQTDGAGYLTALDYVSYLTEIFRAPHKRFTNAIEHLQQYRSR